MDRQFLCFREVTDDKDHILFQGDSIYSEKELNDVPNRRKYFIDVTDVSLEEAIEYGIAIGAVKLFSEEECAYYSICGASNGTEWDFAYFPEEFLDECYIEATKEVRRQVEAATIAEHIKVQMIEETKGSRLMPVCLAQLCDYLPDILKNVVKEVVREAVGKIPRDLKYGSLEEFETLKPGHVIAIGNEEFTVLDFPYYNADADADNKGYEVETNNGAVSIFNDIRVVGFEGLSEVFLKDADFDMER